MKQLERLELINLPKCGDSTAANKLHLRMTLRMMNIKSFMKGFYYE